MAKSKRKEVTWNFNSLSYNDEKRVWQLRGYSPELGSYYGGRVLASAKRYKSLLTKAYQKGYLPA